MKVSLKVAGGIHKGKAIPMTGPHFLIGRDPECQLRPASPSVSKKHCALIIKDGRLFVKDFGSTNGTYVDGVRVEGHAELKDGTNLKAGPLEFFVAIEGRPATAVAENPDAENPASALTVVDDDPAAVDLTPEEGEGKSGTDSERLAAILLGAGGDDDDPATVSESDIPEGSTVFDIPALDEFGNPVKKEEPPKEEEPADNSSTARDLLRQYQQRPRN